MRVREKFDSRDGPDHLLGEGKHQVLMATIDFFSPRNRSAQISESGNRRLSSELETRSQAATSAMACSRVFART